MKFKLFALFIITISSFGLASAQSQKNDDETLKALVRQFTDAQTAFDAKTLDAIFAADYIEISPAGEFDPREKVLGFYKPEDKPDPAKMSTKTEAADFSIRNYGRFAIVIARLNFTVTVDGKTMPPRSMRATYVLRKENSKWKFASAQYTGIRPPQAPKPQ